MSISVEKIPPLLVAVIANLSQWEENGMRKKSKRILAAALSAILIWNTCEWQPQAMAAGSLQRIGAETEADDTAETAEKEAALKNLH